MRAPRGITFGVFDLFHAGHLNLLRLARRQCAELVVCVSTDDYVRQHKGRAPLIPHSERAQIVAACRYVDHIDSQSLTYGKAEAVRDWRPDVIFVGDDWTPETFQGEGLGVPVMYLPYTRGVSTTELRRRILGAA